MSKKLKIIISIILSLLIIFIGIFLIVSNNSPVGEKYSKEFIKSINYIKEENYIEAYNIIKNSDKDEKNIIQTIILHTFTKQLEKLTDVDEKLTNEAKNITNYLTYTYLYSKNPIYQQNIDKIYVEEYQPLFEIKEKIPMEILFDDCNTYYNLYFEYLNLDNGLFSNYEYNILNNKDELLNKLTNTLPTKLNELTDKYEKIIGMHPSSVIPEEYKLLLDI